MAGCRGDRYLQRGRSSEPTKQSYGVDLGFRDPFGNLVRIGQTS